MQTFHPSHIDVLLADGWHDYELLDSGNGQKLERFGEITLVRPEAQALWRPAGDQRDWAAAHTVFEHRERGENWRFNRPVPERWMMQYGAIQCVARLTPFRHVGVFPEQAAQWDWTMRLIRRAVQPRVLNLFGYTGLASVAAALAGAHVTHLDASKPAVEWAKENQAASGLPADSIRWIVDDAIKFVRREIKRGNSYDGIIMDPPAFGRGTQGQVWQFNEAFPLLLALCRQILTPQPLFVLITTYNTQSSALMLRNMLGDLMAERGGTLECGEQVLRETSGGRLLSTSIYARWSSDGGQSAET